MRKTINVSLLKKVRRIITEEPKRLRMADWGLTLTKNQIMHDDEAPACGTVACLAGWIILAHEGNKPSFWKRLMGRRGDLERAVYLKEGLSPAERAADLIGIPLSETPFYNSGWVFSQAISWLNRTIHRGELRRAMK